MIEALLFSLLQVGSVLFMGGLDHCGAGLEIGSFMALPTKAIDTSIQCVLNKKYSHTYKYAIQVFGL